jgi:hypothetical protein
VDLRFEGFELGLRQANSTDDLIPAKPPPTHVLGEKWVPRRAPLPSDKKRPIELRPIELDDTDPA